MQVNAHEISPKKIGADYYEDLAIAFWAIAIGSGLLSLDVSNPVICRQWFNVVFLSGIVTVANSTATSEVIGTVPSEVAPIDLINFSSATIKAD